MTAAEVAFPVCRILGVPIARLGFEDSIRYCLERGRSGQGGAYYFANVHSVTESISNPALREAMAQATACFADGMPLIWVSRRQGEAIASRVCGPDFMRELVARTREEGHGFIGGALGLSERLAEKLGLPRSVHYSPPMRAFEARNVEEDLRQFESKLKGVPWPRWIWVGLGAPKQELWIREAARLRPAASFFGVGAAFDFLSGTKARAPRWMQDAGLEWFFRLASEPRRLAGRYLTTNTKFVVSLLRKRPRDP